MSKQIIKNYTIDTTTKTITFTDFSGLHVDLSRLALITDVTTNKILYNFADASVTATATANSIILSSLPVGTQNTDIIRIDYTANTDEPIYDAVPTYNAKQEHYEDVDRRALKVVNPAFLDTFQAAGSITTGSVIMALQDIGDVTWMAITVNVGGSWTGSINIQQSDDEALFTDSSIINAAQLDLAPLSRITANGRYLVKKTGRYIKAYYDVFTTGAAATMTVQYFTTPWPDFEITKSSLVSYLNTGLTNSAAQVKSGRTKWSKYFVYNPNDTVSYLQVFNKLAANVTLGTTVPDEVYAIPANSSWNGSWSESIDWTTGLSVAATTTAGGNTAPVNNMLVTLGVK